MNAMTMKQAFDSVESFYQERGIFRSGGFKFEVQRVDDAEKRVKRVRQKQFCRLLPSEAISLTGIKFPGDGIKLDMVKPPWELCFYDLGAGLS